MKISYDDIVTALAEHYEVPEECVYEIIDQDTASEVIDEIAKALSAKFEKEGA